MRRGRKAQGSRRFTADEIARLPAAGIPRSATYPQATRSHPNVPLQDPRGEPPPARWPLATVLIAVGITGASGANFNAQTANAGNAFASGALEMSNDESGAILGLSGVEPGDVTDGEVGIENTGTVDGDFTLGMANLTNNNATYKMSTQINLVVKDCGADLDCDTSDDVVTPVYSGSLDAMGTGISLGSWNGGDEHRYEFTATFAASANDNYENRSTTADFVWNATS